MAIKMSPIIRQSVFKFRDISFVAEKSDNGGLLMD